MKYHSIVLLGTLLFCLSACSVSRHVPEGKYVVSRVILDDASTEETAPLKAVVAQNAYHRTFGFLPMSTWIYNLSGADTTKRFNRWLRKVGSEPPIYDEMRSLRTEVAMQRQLQASGFLDAQVSHSVAYRKRKARVTYHIDRNLPKVIDRLNYQVEDSVLARRIEAYRPASPLKKGVRLDRRLLEKERSQLTDWYRNQGYWDFNKENVYFVADTLDGDRSVDLHVSVTGQHRLYRIGTVTFVTNYSLVGNAGREGVTSHCDSLPRKGFRVRYNGDECYLRPEVLVDHCFLMPGHLYSEKAIRDTYNALGRLQVLKYVNVRFVVDSVQPGTLNCEVNMMPHNPNSVQFELDGTNTSGDLGFAAACTYQHKNIFRGAERYSTTLKGGYESLSGNVAGLVNDNYVEVAVENGLTFPKFLFPFLNDDVRLRSRASTDIKASYNYQSRPEYTRIITNATYSYKWVNAERRNRHVLDVVDLSYVSLPKRSDEFVEMIKNSGPFAYSSYQSHLILSMDYNFYYSNAYLQTLEVRTSSQNLWTLRINPEVGGNALQCAARALHLNKEDDGTYHLLGLPFEQFAKLDADFSYSKFLTERSRLAFHLASGVAVPFGNSRVMPFEKRYYAGGANSVRGWSVRTLGPGRYRGTSNRLEYFNQCGDVRLDASMELRSKLFWKFEFAAFLDAGNIWTLKSYEGQEGGAIDKDFYKEIAASWGIGLRFVSDFFVLRLDLGVKAYDPAYPGKEGWVLDSPQHNENRTLHFAVGYPF